VRGPPEWARVDYFGGRGRKCSRRLKGKKTQRTKAGKGYEEKGRKNIKVVPYNLPVGGRPTANGKR